MFILLTANTAHTDQENEPPVLAQALQEETGPGEEGIITSSSQQEEEMHRGSEDPSAESGGRGRRRQDEH